jgi:hypothetical protein
MVLIGVHDAAEDQECVVLVDQWRIGQLGSPDHELMTSLGDHVTEDRRTDDVSVDNREDPHEASSLFRPATSK